MYNLAISMTREAGLAQYEISNFSVLDRECAHNLCYWRAEEYLGYGPGAVGAYDRDGVRYRYTNLKHPEGYSTAVESGAGLHFESENLGDRELNFERIMLGIRLNAGLDLGLVEVDLGGVKKVMDRGWAEVVSGVLTLTNEGRHFCSEVAVLISPG
jgi:oxygen-independent coproporphyrinogen-3 oxidase